MDNRCYLFKFLRNCLSKSGNALNKGEAAFSRSADTSLVDRSTSLSGAPTRNGASCGLAGNPCSPVRT